MPKPLPARETDSEPFALLALQRRRVREFLAMQQERLQRVETELAQQLQQVADGLTHQRQEALAACEGLERREAQVAEQTESLQRLRKELDARLGQWDRLLQSADRQHEALDAQLRQHEEQVHSLHDVCEQLDQEPMDRPLSPAVASDSVQRLCEAIAADLRELKGHGVSFAREAALADTPVVDIDAPVYATLDWEAQKERLLAALHSDQPEDAVTGAVRPPRALPARGTPAEIPADPNDDLDADPMIIEERERLAGLRGQWEDKLRQAEIELSIERAKLARDRAEVDEKLRVMENHGDRTESPADAAATGKPIRGRWLARLGLKEVDEK